MNIRYRQMNRFYKKNNLKEHGLLWCSRYSKSNTCFICEGCESYSWCVISKYRKCSNVISTENWNISDLPPVQLKHCKDNKSDWYECPTCGAVFKENDSYFDHNDKCYCGQKIMR